MTHFVLLLALTLSSPTLSAGSASDTVQCVRGPDGSCRGGGEDSAALLQGRMLVDEGEKENSADAVHGVAGEMEASESSWWGWSKVPKTVKDATNKAAKVKVSEAVAAVKEEGKRIKDVVANGDFHKVMNFSGACRQVQDKACACAKLDKKKNCQKMANRECNGMEKETGAQCWGFIETCAFIWNSNVHGDDKAAELISCAGECRVKFAWETAQYIKACKKNIEESSASLAKDAYMGISGDRISGADFLESEEVSQSMDETLATKKTC